ncbi:MAG: hypothetical protein FJY73_10325 [Candidatus Eisenbacteria bacterium]|nr:hypothetical protein [Candidatus Eisenbacteria bacterium]
MEERRSFGNGLIVGGIAFLLATVLVDFIGIEHSAGIGKVQLAGLLVGVAAAIAGFLLRRGPK